MRLEELLFVVRRSRRISKESSSRLIKLQVPVFILEKHNQTNYKMVLQIPPDGSASSSIKTANAQPVRILGA